MTGLICAIGLVLAGIHVVHVVAHDESILATVGGAIVPLVLALGLFVGGVWLHRSDLTDDAVRVVAAWTVAGGFALGLVSAVAIVHQFIEDEIVANAVFLVATMVTTGALFGTVVGRYDAYNRHKATLVESLQEATTELSEATTRQDVCERAVEIAHRVLDIPLAGVWLYDEDEDALVPVAVAEPSQDHFETPPTYRPGESLSWDVYESETLRAYDDVTREPTVHNAETTIRSEIIVPLGEFGVMNLGSTMPESFDALDVTVARLLGTATTASLRRADREEQLDERRRELRQQNERLDEFTSFVSHDLKTPLSVASGRLQLARETLDDPDGDLEAVDDALDRMESLIDELLALARQGRTVGETTQLSLADAAESAWERIQSAEASLRLDADRSLHADPERLGQLLENLFRNAIAHGGRDVTITVGATDAGFYVEDDGSGIQSDERERLFDAGYTTDADGTGFGLAIVRRVAEAHGWSVTVDNGAQGGARFDVTFDTTEHDEFE